MADSPAAVAFQQGGLAVSALINDYRHRAGELTKEEMAQAIELMRKQRTVSTENRVAKKTAAKAKAGPSADELFGDLDAFAAKAKE